MIIVIKGRNKKQLIIKVASMLSLVLIFGLYYNHMSSKFAAMNNNVTLNTSNPIEQKQISKSMKLENVIYKESVVIVDLLNQKNIKSIKVLKDKLLIICNHDTNIDPLLVRYGVNAMVKRSTKDIKIALDLAIIVENKYES